MNFSVSLKVRLVTVLLGSLWASTACSADDPAIIVCEAVLKSTLKAPKSYERVDAAIQKNLVHITFDAVNSYNAPIRDIKTCAFSPNDSGNFALDSLGLIQGKKHIKAIRKEAEDMERNGAVTKENIAALKDALDKEMSMLPDHTMEHMLAVEAARTTGLYPINPGSTKLVPGRE